MMFIYIISFIILMDPSTQAVNKNYEIEFECTFKYSESFQMVDTNMGCSKTYRRESLWNWVFYPAEIIWKMGRHAK